MTPTPAAPAAPAPHEVATVLQERIYGGIACLSTLLVLVRHLDGDTTAWIAFVDVAVATGSLWAASLLADYVAHLAAHGRGFRRDEAAGAVLASVRSCRRPLCRSCSS